MTAKKQDAFKIKDLREKTAADLKEMLISLKKEQINRRFSAAMGQLENPARSRIIRRAVARIKTLLAQQSPLNEK